MFLGTARLSARVSWLGQSDAAKHLDVWRDSGAVFMLSAAQQGCDSCWSFMFPLDRAMRQEKGDYAAVLKVLDTSEYTARALMLQKKIAYRSGGWYRFNWA